MIALYIILGIIFFLGLLLVCNLSLRISFDGKFLSEVRFLFFRFKLPEDFKNKSKKGKKSEKTDQGEEKQSSFKKSIKEKGIVKTLKEIRDVLKVVFGKVGKITKHIKVKTFLLDITVANSDPALVGVEYGAVCAVLSPIITWLRNTLKFNDNKTKISVNSDFCGGESGIKFFAVVKIRLWFVVLTLLSVLKGVIKSKIEKTNISEVPKNKRSVNNGRK